MAIQIGADTKVGNWYIQCIPEARLHSGYLEMRLCEASRFAFNVREDGDRAASTDRSVVGLLCSIR